MSRSAFRYYRGECSLCPQSVSDGAFTRACTRLREVTVIDGRQEFEDLPEELDAEVEDPRATECSGVYQNCGVKIGMREICFAPDKGHRQRGLARECISTGDLQSMSRYRTA